uniref:Uncharacterized protein n=1 Tax=Onchocerca volvulus TaxID=6282 RepID=A0A8R1XX28_ONCVO
MCYDELKRWQGTMVKKQNREKNPTEGRGESKRVAESFEMGMQGLNKRLIMLIGFSEDHILGSDDIGDLRPLYVLHVQRTIPSVLVGLHCDTPCVIVMRSPLLTPCKSSGAEE